MKRAFSVIFMLVGVLCVVAAFWLVKYNQDESEAAGKDSARVLDSLQVTISDNIGEPSTVSPYEALSDNPQMSVEFIEGYNYIGVLEIPSVKILLPVMDTCDYERLSIAPCRFTGTYYTNDLVICGHNYSTHFWPLLDVNIGADVYLTTTDGNVYKYIVVNREDVAPTAVDTIINNNNGEWDLTLFTCDFSGQNRCCVRCVLKK